MKSYFKFLFFKTCSIILNATSYLLFGMLLAFIVLAFQNNNAEKITGISAILADFLDSDRTSQVFTAKDFTEGLAYIIFKNEKNETNVTHAVSSIPKVSVDKGLVEVLVPFYANLFGFDIKFNAFVNLDCDGKSVNIESAKIGNAKLPHFIQNKFAKSLMSFYSDITINSKKYNYDLRNAKFKITDTNDIKIIK